MTTATVHSEGDIRVLRALAQRIDPGDAGAYNNLGVVFMKQSEFSEAVKYYGEALRVNPNYAIAHNNLGNALMEQGRLDEATKHHREALRMKSGYANAHSSLAIALMRQGKLDEAEEHYRKALRISPDHATTHNNLGNILMRQGKFDEAEEHYRKALDINSDYARELGIFFTLPEEMRPIYESLGIDIEKHNGKGQFDLPLPATFVVDVDGTITYAFVDTDYTLRSEPAEIVKELQSLVKGVL